jgi:hypothetical protein
VGRQVGLRVVVRHLEARHDEHSVQSPRALGLGVHGGEIRAEVRLVHARFGQVPGIVGAKDVIRDAEDVEAGAAVEIDELPQCQLAVAPGGVGVKLAEQLGFHALSFGRRGRHVGNGVVNVVGKGSSPPARFGGLPGRLGAPTLQTRRPGTVDGGRLPARKAVETEPV